MNVLLGAMMLVPALAGCTLQPAQCYVDVQSRILGPTNYNSYDGLNNEFCAQLCANQNLTLAGTENGIECYCGMSVTPDAKKADASNCNIVCRGYPNEQCGGNWFVSVFAFKCTDPPVPPPPETPRMVNPCRNASFSKMPWCDATLPIDSRVADMLSRMTLAEKIGNMGNEGVAIASLGLSSYNWWSEATHGVASFRADMKTPTTTNFPFPITTGMSFNRSLWRATGAHIGKEARALMNAGNAYSTFWTPVINLARDPRWGRNIETPGEDPYLTGEYATAYVQGFQEAKEDPYHVQASACCKHYVANSMEDSTEVGVHHWRNEYDAHVPVQDLVDSYMLPFQACVEKGRVTGLMCSYNAVNGVPSCANDWLQNTVARGEWGFDGYITSDCDADYDVFYNHHYTSTPEEAVKAVLHAGTDVDCGGFVSQFAQGALDKQLITVSDLDVRLSYLFRLRMRLGHFDPEGPLDKIDIDVICSPYALDLSYDGVAQGSTLLKNDKKTLPLSTQLKSVVVIGPNSLLSRSIAGYYGPDKVCNMQFWTVVDAVKRFVSNTTTFLGVPDVKSDDMSLIPAAVAAAKGADAIVLAIGTDLSVAAEGHDTNSIALSKGQAALIEQVAAAAAGKPVVVVTLTAVPLDLSNVLSNPNVGAVLHVGQPSVAVLGVGDILFGKKVPAGRLIQTILPSSYTSEISIFDMGMRPGPSSFARPDCPGPVSSCPNATNPGRTHRFYTGKPVLPFGFGLSYTTFSYALHAAPPATMSLAPVRAMLAQAAGRMLSLASPAFVEYAVNVTNTGSVDADDVVLGFIIPPGAGTGGVPLQSLFGFERVRVAAGKTVTVWLYPSLKDMTQVNSQGQSAVWEGEYQVRFGLEEKDHASVTHRFVAA